MVSISVVSPFWNEFAAVLSHRHHHHHRHCVYAHSPTDGSYKNVFIILTEMMINVRITTNYFTSCLLICDVLVPQSSLVLSSVARKYVIFNWLNYNLKKINLLNYNNNAGLCTIFENRRYIKIKNIKSKRFLYFHLIVCNYYNINYKI